ncbi:MAG: uracil-DNA glycosylase [Longimicrobiales bacterium]|nr:uracil-DNA glycosylase [Longimicrobiales bacterium]
MSSGESDASDALARLLRQRLEMGTQELFLGSLSREKVLEMVGEIRSGGARATPAAEASRAAPSAAASSGAATSADSSSETRAVSPSEPSGASDPEGLDEKERAVRTGDAGEEIVKTFDYETLREVALGCRRCGLAEERKQVVFADGSRTARLMVVGEAPGAREDATGLPFVGPAGKLLDLLLATVNLSREDSVYICNVIKCRPPGNRNPLPDEIEACAPYLRRQIELVSPEAILAVGTFAGRLLTGKDSTLGNLRGDVYSYEGVPLLVTYHPAALLRNRRWVRATWDDLQLLRGVLDGAA